MSLMTPCPVLEGMDGVGCSGEHPHPHLHTRTLRQIFPSASWSTLGLTVRGQDRDGKGSLY